MNITKLFLKQNDNSENTEDKNIKYKKMSTIDTNKKLKDIVKIENNFFILVYQNSNIEIFNTINN